MVNDSRDLDIRLTRLEEQVKSYARSEWVSESLGELTRTVDLMGINVSDVVKQIGIVSTRQEDLYKTHDALLKQRAEQERQEFENTRKVLQAKLEDRNPLNIAKRWLPITSLLIAIVALFRILGSLIEAWLAKH